MKSYRTQVKADVLMALGMIDADLVNRSTLLDEAVIKTAGKVLSKAEKLTFFFLYECKPTWRTVVEQLFETLGKHYEEETVQSYARGACQKIQQAAAASPELRAWKIAFLKATEESGARARGR